MVDLPHTQASTKYVFNASSLINLENLKQLRLLDRIGDRVIVPKPVEKEVNKPRSGLETWLSHNLKSVVNFLGDEGRFYLSLLGQPAHKIGDGEAAAIAVAMNRKHTLVIDDKAAMDKAQAHGVHCLTTHQFLQLPLIGWET